MQLTDEQQAFKDAYIEARGYWVDFNDGLLKHSPEWLQAYLKYAETPARDGPLSAKLREMIYVAIDASTTHMFTEGMEIHIKLAFKAGCTVGELIEVMQIATMQGFDSVSAGMTILVEEASAAGITLPKHSNGESILDRYELMFGDRPVWLQALARAVPKYTEILVDLLTTADQHSNLPDKDKILIRLALAASPTHLNREAMRTETRRALSAGATSEEIIEVFQLAAHLGIHACVDGVPAITATATE
ncbi:hypothetical protein G8770_11365 [Aestuariicella hydrocarbonica]|uniref:Carboxymuconolactone decarboxylase-like domain-containing protein n=1 Tax=Pseudomaricurvus hydrocarbonicus TaxID=1470433 RepID=A0A9E5JWG0_9GAMM|nr:carboxymuconolactone decarboxylase family protein [Aestuariicella hydrocarbonica]NHO66145.1 hypothetical protein [Aestuariicella hydrocarbonica]